MNSDEERVLFESWGWTQDLVGRRWVSPVRQGMHIKRCAVVTYDELMDYTTTPWGEQELKDIIRRWGIRQS